MQVWFWRAALFKEHLVWPPVVSLKPLVLCPDAQKPWNRSCPEKWLCCSPPLPPYTCDTWRVFNKGFKEKASQANIWCSPLQLEVGHGSVGVQKDVHAVGLHSFAVTLNSCLIFAFLEISISLTATGTVTGSHFAPFMQLKLYFLCYDMTSESRLHNLYNTDYLLI